MHQPGVTHPEGPESYFPAAMDHQTLVEEAYSNLDPDNLVPKVALVDASI